jgi:hypothetical protein
MKYWEVIADNLSKGGWSWDCVSAIDSNGQTIWMANAHRRDGLRVSQSDQRWRRSGLRENRRGRARLEGLRRSLRSDVNFPRLRPVGVFPVLLVVSLFFSLLTKLAGQFGG